MNLKNKINPQVVKITAAGLMIAGLLFLVYTSVYSGRKKSDYFQGIMAPVKAVDIPLTEFAINADSSAHIRLSTGTSIHIAPNTFVKSNGEKVSGKVALKVREFHNAEQIFRSGVSMSTDASRNDFLESAGMIEVRAFGDGSPLEIKDGKYIDIDLAGFRSSEGYDLYYLDNDKNWVQKNSFNRGVNIEKSINQQQLDSLIKQAPDSNGLDNDYYFNLVGNVEMAPYLKPFLTLDWVIKSKDITPMTLESMRVNWDKVEIKVINRRKMKYELVFTKELESNEDNQKINKRFITTAYPIINGMKRWQAREVLEEKMMAYEDMMKKMEEEKERLAKEADMMNSFKINKMGIWNCDKVMDRSDFIYAALSFDFEKNIDLDVSHIQLFAIYKDNNSVIPYRHKDWRKVALSKTQKMNLIAVLPNDVIAIVKEDEVMNTLKSSNAQLFFKTTKVNAKDYFAVK